MNAISSLGSKALFPLTSIAISAGFAAIGCASSPSPRGASITTTTSLEVPAPQRGNAIQPITATTPTDDEVMSVISIALARQLEQTQLGRDRATSPRVRAYADHVAREESASKSNWDGLTKVRVAATKPSDTSLRLSTDADLALESMRTRNGSDFDRTFIDSEVARNAELLDLIDRRLLPITENATLRNTLIALRPQVLAHLQLADQIARELIAAQ
jgi:putative membrane protein